MSKHDYTNQVFMYYQDSAHGWIEVPRKLLTLLGVLETISHCSYQKGHKVYLEEDSDADKFVEAFRAKFGHPPNFGDPYPNTQWPEESPIRSYQPFCLR